MNKNVFNNYVFNNYLERTRSLFDYTQSNMTQKDFIKIKIATNQLQPVICANYIRLRS